METGFVFSTRAVSDSASQKEKLHAENVLTH